MSVPSVRQRALLAALVLRANQVVSAERLISDAWGEEPPATAPHGLRVHLSQLRQLLAVVGRPVIETRSPGYVVRAAPEQLDLQRFERALEAGSRALADNDPERAARDLSAALDLWRGPALSDLANEPFARLAILRLEELRLLALEHRIEADLALGRDGRVIPELRDLTREHPQREHLWSQLMLALYGAGRQAEALEAYRSAHAALVEIGLEPTPALKALQGAILRQDADLSRPSPSRPGERRADPRVVLALSLGCEPLAPLAAAAAEIAGGRPRAEVVLARAIDATRGGPHGGVGADDARQVQEAGDAIQGSATLVRAVSFRSYRRAEDVGRLALTVDAAMLVLAAGDQLERDVRLAADAVAAIGAVACDAGVAVGWSRAVTPGDVVVPFGGGHHDWAALELAGRLARDGRKLTLVGLREPATRTDASFLLATASLALQRLIGVMPDVRLVPRDADALVEEARKGGLVVTGFSSRGVGAPLGSWRLALIRSAAVPLIIVRRGERPGLAAPADAATRYTWSSSQVS